MAPVDASGSEMANELTFPPSQVQQPVAFLHGLTLTCVLLQREDGTTASGKSFSVSTVTLKIFYCHSGRQQ